jgi:regulator of protease activity HflC (stomatin/prohibitin superfamily)
VGNIYCLSNDKIEIELEVKIQIHLLRESLISLILRQFSNKDRHRKFLEHVAVSTLITSCLNYDVDNFFSDRSSVDRDMFANLQTAINDYDFGADVEFFQLTHIQLPTNLVEVITEKQNIEQELITATNDRTNELIQAQTDFLEAEQKSLVILIEANNTANVITNQAQAEEEIIKSKWSNAATAYASVANSLSLDEDEFVEYLGAELYRLVDHSVVN